MTSPQQELEMNEMKARRKVFSPLFPRSAHTAQLVVANEGTSRTGDSHGALSDLERRILGELSKVRHSRLSDALANRTKDRRSAVVVCLRQMLGLGLVRQPKDSKNGFKITEAGRAAWLAAVGRRSLKPPVR